MAKHLLSLKHQSHSKNHCYWHGWKGPYFQLLKTPLKIQAVVEGDWPPPDPTFPTWAAVRHQDRLTMP